MSCCFKTISANPIISGDVHRVIEPRKEEEKVKRTEFVQDQLKCFPGSDEQVLYFIADFLYHQGTDSAETIRYQFHSGYCYYFAHMLKQAFQRGEVCIAAPFGHFVWKDKDDICYDVEGVSASEAEYFIPESFMGNMVKDFLHIRNIAHNTTQKEIEELIERYKKSLTLKNYNQNTESL